VATAVVICWCFFMKGQLSWPAVMPPGHCDKTTQLRTNKESVQPVANREQGRPVTNNEAGRCVRHLAASSPAPPLHLLP
jgi:hypothetical protein